MLQTQLREAQRELERAAQQHRDDLTALRQEGSSLLQDKMNLQKQVPVPLPAPQPFPSRARLARSLLQGKGTLGAWEGKGGPRH